MVDDMNRSTRSSADSDSGTRVEPWISALGMVNSEVFFLNRRAISGSTFISRKQYVNRVPCNGSLLWPLLPVVVPECLACCRFRRRFLFPSFLSPFFGGYETLAWQ